MWVTVKMAQLDLQANWYCKLGLMGHRCNCDRNRYGGQQLDKTSYGQDDLRLIGWWLEHNFVSNKGMKAEKPMPITYYTLNCNRGLFTFENNSDQLIFYIVICRVSSG